MAVNKMYTKEIVGIVADKNSGEVLDIIVGDIRL